MRYYKMPIMSASYSKNDQYILVIVHKSGQTDVYSYKSKSEAQQDGEEMAKELGKDVGWWGVRNMVLSNTDTLCYVVTFQGASQDDEEYFDSYEEAEKYVNRYGINKNLRIEEVYCEDIYNCNDFYQ